MKRIVRRVRVLSFVLAALCLTIMVSGCSNRTTTTASPRAAGSKKETLRIITFFAGSDQWAPVWKEVIAEYMTANPHITISDESLPTAGTNDVFRPKMNADIAAKTPADAALYFNGSDAKPLLDSGLYVTWDSFFAADPAWKAQFIESSLPAGESEGKLIALPYIGFFEGLTYNAKIFKDHNLEPPTSWDNILKAVDVLSKTDIVPAASTLLNPTCMLELILLAEVGPQGQKDILNDKWAPALDRIKLLYQRGAFTKDAATITDGDCRTLFTSGRTAMGFYGSWVLNSLRDNPDMRIVAMKPPAGSAGTDGAIIAGFGSGWYMSKQASERSEETLKFVKYMCSPEILTRFIQVGGSPAMKIELPSGTEPVLVSAAEMTGAATAMNNPIDAQMPREIFNKLAKELIYVCAGEKTSLQLLKECRELLASR